MSEEGMFPWLPPDDREVVTVVLPPPDETAVMVKDGTESGEEALEEESVTVIVQFEYVPALNVLKVMVFAPTEAAVVVEEQEPPYVIVPASSVVKVYVGVVLVLGVGTGVVEVR